MFKIYIDGIEELGKNWELPIPPNKEFKIDVKNDYEEADIYGLGKIIKKENKGLEEVSWSSFLPSINNLKEASIIAGQTVDMTLTPDKICEILKKSTNMVITLKVNIEENDEIEPYINKEYIIASFNTKDVFGRVGDIQYTIDLKEYKEPKIYEHPIPQPPITTTTTPTITYNNSPPKENKTPPPEDEFSIGDRINIVSCNDTYNAFMQYGTIESDEGKKGLRGRYDRAKNDIYKELSNKVGVIKNIDKNGFYLINITGEEETVRSDFYYIKLDAVIKDKSIIKQLEKGIAKVDQVIGNTIRGIMDFLAGTTSPSNAIDTEKIDDVKYVWLSKNTSNIERIKGT